MFTDLSPTFVLQDLSDTDEAIASVTFGITLGLIVVTGCDVGRQTFGFWRRHGACLVKSLYVWMIWAELLVCLVYAIICFLYLRFQAIGPSFAFYFSILLLWSLQVQFLLQIIINRISILLHSRRKILWLKFGVAAVITAINISVFAIWMPARLQISVEHERINDIWDRCEKVIYLCIDAALNGYFIHIVIKELVGVGLDKYRRVIRFNLCLIAISLLMDVMIITMMSLSNGFVYNQFHPLAYIVKLKIELTMAKVIARVSKTKGMRLDDIDEKHVVVHGHARKISRPYNITFHQAARGLIEANDDDDKSTTGMPENAILNIPSSVRPAMSRQDSLASTTTMSRLLRKHGALSMDFYDMDVDGMLASPGLESSPIGGDDLEAGRQRGAHLDKSRIDDTDTRAEMPEHATGTISVDDRGFVSTLGR